MIAALFLLLADAAALERQAFRAYQTRDWAAAARLYHAFHEAAPGNSSTYDNLGVALTNLGRWGEAEAALRRALELDSNHRWAYNHLGFVLRERGRLEDAAQMFRRQIRVSPKDPYAYRNLAATLALLDRLEEADAVALQHEQYTYEKGAVFIDIACTLNARRRSERAKAYLEKAEAAGVERSLLVQERAHYYLTVHDVPRAEEEYRKLLQYRPYDPAVAMRLATLYHKTGKVLEAAELFGRVITVDSADRVTVRLSASAERSAPLADLVKDPRAVAALLGDIPVDLGRAALLVRAFEARRQYFASKSSADLSRFQSACKELVEADSAAGSLCQEP